MVNNQMIATNIKKIIKDKGLKQCVIAERVGVSPNEFSSMLHGRKTIKAEHVPNIANALDVSIEYIFGIASGNLKQNSIFIGSEEYSEIFISDKDNNLIASITAQNTIEEEDYKVVCVPYMN